MCINIQTVLETSNIPRKQGHIKINIFNFNREPVSKCLFLNDTKSE